jgi:hypothetical protein
MVGKTRKALKHLKKQNRGLTVPQLRKSFEHIHSYVKKHNNDVPGFRKEWKKIFGKDVSEEAARDYLAFMKEHGTRAQSGGSFSPAPIDYDMRAGADIPYGNFPAYVSSGFGFANIDSFHAQSGKEDITPILPQGLGSNAVMKGGKRKTRKGKQHGGAYLPSLTTAVSEFVNRPFGMNSPPTTSQQTQMEIKGVNGFPSGRPEDNPLPSLTNQPIYSASISPASRSF